MDLAEVGHSMEAVLQYLVSNESTVKLHHRSLPSVEELDIMESIVSARRSSKPPDSTCTLADALQKRTAEALHSVKGVAT
jgi:hypothetical protein